MILGKIFGKISTNNFKFVATHETKKFEYLQVYHKVYGYVLSQVIDLVREEDTTLANCSVIGYKDENNKIKGIRIPFEPETEVLRAEDEFIKEIIRLEEDKKSAFVGRLEGRDIDIHIDLNKLLTKHVAILAKSGAGKSYTVGVLLEEIMDRKIPLLIIDPHGEYSELKEPNNDEKQKLESYGLEPKSYSNIKEYGDSNLNSNLRHLILNNSLLPEEVTHLMPSKPSGTQIGLLYSAIKHLDTINFINILFELEKEENNAKWALINNLEYLKNLELFGENYTNHNELIQSNNCSIINLKGIPPDVQEIIVYKLLKDLFEKRKQNKIPPFFTVIEEAHNYCPERSFGETKCSKIIRTVASEGRKFGMGLCVVSQRPARVDKSVLSQCTTQLILKVTNPNDLKSITGSVEGITSESEQEIQNLPIGTSMVTGVTDTPLFVNIRPRKTKHGGVAVDILEESSVVFEDKIADFESQDLLPIITPRTSLNDLKIMSQEEIKQINNVLIPCVLFLCKNQNQEFNILMDKTTGEIVVDIEDYKTKKLPSLAGLSKNEIGVLRFAHTQKKGFLEEDLIKKGASLDITSLLDELIKKKLLIIDENKYFLSEDYIFSNLSKHACFEKINYVNIDYNKLSEEKLRTDNLKEKLSKFCSVEDQNECYLLRYEIIR
ncbi:ATP-binding protein [Candidatus Woesearchaeota archaeon]|nr:ATP-binding protein [Candidatus Woesearchaeota archaeon]